MPNLSLHSDNDSNSEKKQLIFTDSVAENTQTKEPSRWKIYAGLGGFLVVLIIMSLVINLRPGLQTQDETQPDTQSETVEGFRGNLIGGSSQNVQGLCPAGTYYNLLYKKCMTQQEAAAASVICAAGSIPGDNGECILIGSAHSGVPASVLNVGDYFVFDDDVKTGGGVGALNPGVDIDIPSVKDYLPKLPGVTGGTNSNDDGPTASEDPNYGNESDGIPDGNVGDGVPSGTGSNGNSGSGSSGNGSNDSGTNNGSNNGSSSCTEIEAKLDLYRDNISSENIEGLSTAEIEILEYMLDAVIVEAIENNCDLPTQDFLKALDCSETEMFDTRIKACKSAPGYSNDSAGSCSELTTAIAAIDKKLADNDIDSQDEALLTALKLDLALEVPNCTQQSTNGGGSSSGGGGSSGSSSGGGGGGSLGPNDKDKTEFAIKDFQVLPETFNPFKKSTKVYFFLTQESIVTLEVVDGAEVIRTIKVGTMNAGSRIIEWDGKTDSGGFVPAKEYELILTAQKPINLNNKISEKGFATVSYFANEFESEVDATFEDILNNFGNGTGEGSGTTGDAQANGSQSGDANNNVATHGVASPLAQNIHAEGQGKTTTSETGPNLMMYLFLIGPTYYLVWKPIKKSSANK